MVKRSFTCLSLALALLAGSAGATFNDITDENLAQGGGLARRALHHAGRRCGQL